MSNPVVEFVGGSLLAFGGIVIAGIGGWHAGGGLAKLLLK